MSKENPLISIGMCVYNEERFISQALDSLLSQTYRNFELIIVDNASEDATGQICQDYQSRDNRIRYFRNAANIGGAGSSKLVLAKSSGKYFMLAGGHDLWHPDYISECLNVLESDPQVVLCYAQVLVIDQNGHHQQLVKKAIDTRSLDDFDRCRATIWGLSRIPICDPIYGLMRTDSLRRAGLRNVWGPDNLILIELSLNGAIAQVKNPLYYRRMNRNPSKDVALWTEKYLERIDPENIKKRIVLTYSRMCYEYFKIISRSDFTIPQKMTLFVDAFASICHRWGRGMLFHDFICAPIRLLFGHRAVYEFKRCIYSMARNVNLYK